MKGKLFRVVAFVVLSVLTNFALGNRTLAQQSSDNKSALSPLVRVLQAKGILTSQEVAQLSQASSASDADQRLAKLLLMKGVISQADYDQTVAAPDMMNASSNPATTPTAIAAVYRVPIGSGASVAPLANAAPPASSSSDQAAPSKPAVIPAIAPIRVFPVGGLPREGLKPALTIGPVRVTPYGFLKATLIRDSSSPYGNDFPLPAFLQDMSGNPAPEFRVRARASRIGTNFEWLDPSPRVTVTGKFELDFEGNFTRVNNRNISTIRSSTPSIRLGYGRLDYKATDKDTFSFLIGQDWTPFGSSTLPNILETTGFGFAVGTLDERAPQTRFGWTHDFEGFKLMPELALVLPAYGNVPSNVADELGFGERQGVDSDRPEVEGQLVGQFQLDHAPGVAPAQLIVSFVNGERKVIVAPTAIPCTNGKVVPVCPAATNGFRAAFPQGTSVTSSRNGWSGEAQLPTRYVTLLGKFYSGSDLRFFFAGQLLSNYTDTFGLTGIARGTSVDGSSTVVFGISGTTPAVAPQRPIRAQGGFINLGFPLSRIFGADASGRNNGWSLYLHYGVDFAKARDVRHAGGGRHRGDLGAGTLYYKLNNWVTFAVEESYYRTVAVPLTSTRNFPLFNGFPSRSWHDFRSEAGTIFTF